MKILMLLNNHFTHDARVLKEGKTLVQAGYDVTLRCYWDEGLPESEIRDGIKVERVLHVDRRFRKNLFQKFGLLFAFLKKATQNTKDYDVIHCHDLMTLPMGVMAKWRNSKDQKIIYDSHEYQIEQSGKPKWMKPFMKVLEGFCIKRVNHVITVSDSIANEYVRIYKINKPWLVLNCPNYVETPQRDIFRQKYNLSQDTMVFLYQGGFSPNRGIEQILEAFQSLKDPKKIIVFMGYGVLAEDIQKAASKSNNIFYHDAVEHDVLLEYTASADIGILTYQNTCLNHYYCSPNKFFEYTMAGLPIIVSNLYELSRLVKNYGNGFIIKENTAESLQDTVLNLTPDDIKSSKENIGAMKQEFCWEQQENTLLKIYKSII